MIKTFDAVVIATGHYHAPYVPDLPGLADWRRKWPDNVIHSKQYRIPEQFKDKARTSANIYKQKHIFTLSNYLHSPFYLSVMVHPRWILQEILVVTSRQFTTLYARVTTSLMRGTLN